MTPTLLYQQLRTHAQGEMPQALIQRRRPHESPELMRYRTQIWEPITRQPFNRVVQSLGKIRRSPDWLVKYPAPHPLIAPQESLESYCEQQMPRYGSVTTWVFSELLPALMVDANCAILVQPLTPPSYETEYLRPAPTIYHSDQIIDYVEGKYALLRNPLATRNPLTPEGGIKTNSPLNNSGSFNPFAGTDTQNAGLSSLPLGEGWGGVSGGVSGGISGRVLLVTPSHIVPYQYVGDSYQPIVSEVIEHGLGYLPIIRPRGQLLRMQGAQPIYESRLAAMLPSLNEAAREYSDLQAAVVGHLFPERWEVATHDCASCQGTGQQLQPSGMAPCERCGGQGVGSAAGPYRKFVIRPAKVNLGEQPVPTPPFDYVKKDVEVIRVMEERIDKHLYRALSAVNMQFLMQVPQSISGEAKRVDREELNNFVYTVAEDLIYVMDQLYALVAQYRYGRLLPAAQIRELLPSIAVPQTFDLIDPDYYVEELGRARANNLSPVITSSMEYEYATRKFYAQPTLAATLRATLSLDPLAGVSDADKALRLQNGGVTLADYTLSCNIHQLVTRAVAEVPGFLSMSWSAQRDVVRGIS